MPSTMQLDSCGRRRSPATQSSFHQGRPPRNKGQRYPADPPTVEEITAVMHAAGDDNDNDAVRLRGRGASCSGAQGCVSAKRWLWARATWT